MWHFHARYYYTWRNLFLLILAVRSAREFSINFWHFNFLRYQILFSSSSSFFLYFSIQPIIRLYLLIWKLFSLSLHSSSCSFFSFPPFLYATWHSNKKAELFSLSLSFQLSHQASIEIMSSLSLFLWLPIPKLGHFLLTCVWPTSPSNSLDQKLHSSTEDKCWRRTSNTWFLQNSCYVHHRLVQTAARERERKLLAPLNNSVQLTDLFFGHSSFFWYSLHA